MGYSGVTRLIRSTPRGPTPALYTCRSRTGPDRSRTVPAPTPAGAGAAAGPAGENRQPADAATGSQKNYGWRWKRCRRSLKHRRDEASCRSEQDRVSRLQAAEALGQVYLFYFDAAGFNLIP